MQEQGWCKKASAELQAAEEARLAEERQKRLAQSAVQDMTKNIQRQHEKEMKALQMLGASVAEAPKKTAPAAPKVGRNDPCPCGSGKKYKKCHGTDV